MTVIILVVADAFGKGAVTALSAVELPSSGVDLLAELQPKRHINDRITVKQRNAEINLFIGSPPKNQLAKGILHFQRGSKFRALEKFK